MENTKIEELVKQEVDKLETINDVELLANKIRLICNARKHEIAKKLLQNHEKFSDYLNENLSKTKTNVNDVAKGTGITRTTIHNWKRSRTTPSFSNRKKIESFFENIKNAKKEN